MQWKETRNKTVDCQVSFFVLGFRVQCFLYVSLTVQRSPWVQEGLFVL